VFARLGSWCFRRRKTVVVAWIVGLVVFGGVVSAAGTESRSEFELPNVESRRGNDIFDEHFGGKGSGLTAPIVFQADQGVDDPEVRQAMEELFAEVDAMTIDGEDVAISSPYAAGGERQIAEEGPLAGQIAFAEVEVPDDIDQELAFDLGEDIRAAAPDVEGLRLEVGGQLFAEFDPPTSEAIGLGFAVVVLIVAFGSVLAMGLPIGVAIGGIAFGLVAGGLLSNIVSMPDVAATLAIMIGLGVGIDYALLIVTRFRENLHRGHDHHDSAVIALDTAGRSVIFAGTTVVVSLLGMVIMGIDFVTGLAVSAATVVACTMVASVTLLPALLGFAGSRLEVTRRRGLIAAGFLAVGLVGAGLGATPLFLLAVVAAVVVILASLVAQPLRQRVLEREPKPLNETAAYRWSRVIQHHPWRSALAGLAALGVLALPVFGMRLAFADEGNLQEDTDARQAYDLLAEGFGPGFNGVVLVATELPDGADPAALEEVSAALNADPGVEFASQPRLNDADAPAAAMWRVVPATAPQDEDTTDLVNRLRDEVIPAATEGTRLDPAVTGQTAVGVDFSTFIGDRLPYFFAAVIGLSFLLLMIVFRSLLVPLKAAVMNLLSIGAAFGVVVAAFQWGWAGPLLDVESAPIEPWMPMMLFAIVFGLSMDYEVFLLSRVREEYDRTGDNNTAVADGLAATARVITAAAAIMVVVFGSFLLEDDRAIKVFGVGLATAIFLDATVVRMLLVPATMELLGGANWWLPRWLGRLLPRVSVEGRADEGAPPPSPPETQRDRELEPV
jgi:putative drug exporter of the RND superfamily